MSRHSFEGRVVAEIKGQVVSITASGDLVTNINVTDLGSAPRDETLKVLCEGHTTYGLFEADHGQPDMTFLAFENKSNCVQISIVGGDASGFLGIGVCAEVVVLW